MAAEWKKMKVQALREELANRGLDTVGLKATLVERLEKYSSKLADGSDTADVAKEDGEKIESDGIEKDGERIENEVDENEGDGLEDGESAKTSEVTIEVEAAVTVTGTSGTSVESQPLATESTEEGKKEGDSAPAEHVKPQETNGAGATTPLSDLEKKQKRAERFGTEFFVSEVEKRRMRGVRFNGGSPNGNEKGAVTPPPSADKASKKSPTSNEAETVKRKARAERFRVSTESGGKLQLSADDEAKKKARMARFGVMTK